MKHTIITCFLLFISSSLFAESYSFQIQLPGGHPKKSNTIESGSRFVCLQDSSFKTQKLNIVFKKGTIGWRFEEDEFFIAEGHVQFSEITQQKRFGFDTPPPIFRFSRGYLKPKTGDCLSILNNAEVRWGKNKHTERGSIYIDKKRYSMQFERLLIASHSETYLLEWNHKFLSYSNMITSPLSKLLVSNKILKDDNRSRTFRSKFEKSDFQLKQLQSERSHHLEQSRRYARIK